MPERGPPRHTGHAPLAQVSGLLDLDVELREENERLHLEIASLRGRMLELEALVERDTLAPVYNRRGLLRELAKAIAHGRRYGEPAALFYLDLNGFKAINDRYGHAAGDAVLGAVGDALARATRLSDSVARVGGDEFVLILRRMDEAQAQLKCAALRDLVAGLRVPFEGEVLSVTAAVGTARIEAHDAPDDVIARADAAMYREKRHG